MVRVLTEEEKEEYDYLAENSEQLSFEFPEESQNKEV